MMKFPPLYLQMRNISCLMLARVLTALATALVTVLTVTSLAWISTILSVFS